MFDATFSTSKPQDDLPTSDSINTFYHSGSSRPDTGALLAEIGMPAHEIRSIVATQAGLGTDG